MLSKIDEIYECLSDATEALNDAILTFNNESFKASSNRQYYCLYHLMCACLTTIDFRKHATHAIVIGKFRELFIKSGIFDVNLSRILGSVEKLRNESDYHRGYTPIFEVIASSLEETKYFYQIVSQYISEVVEGM